MKTSIPADGPESAVRDTIDPIAESSSLTEAIAGSATEIAEFRADELLSMLDEAKASLREIEARYRTLVELSSDWYWEHDEHQRFTSVSEQILEKTGIPVAQLIGRTRWETNIRYDAVERARLESDIAARQPFYDFRFDGIAADGTVRHLTVSGAPMFDASGRYAGYRGIGKDVTERRREQIAGRESQLFARAALDALADQICMIDAAGTIITVNSAWRSLSATGSAVAIGAFMGTNLLRACDDGSGSARGDGVAVATGLRSILAGAAPSFQHEYSFETPTELRWFALKATGFETHGEIRAVVVNEDITERKRAERVLALEQDVARHLGDGEEADVALGYVLRAICEFQHWSCGFFSRTDNATGGFRVSASWGISTREVKALCAAMRDTVADRDEDLVGDAWRTGHSRWIEDLSLDAGPLAHRDLVAKAGMRCGFVLPITDEGRTLGVLTLFGGESRARDADVSAMARVADTQISQFLKRKYAEEALRESEARFRSLSDLSADWYWHQDAQLRFTSLCNGTEIDAGLAPDADCGKTRWEISGAGEADWDLHKRTLAAHLPFLDFEMTRTFPDGSTRDICVSGTPIRDAKGSFSGYRGIGRDITRRKLEERILALEHRVAQCIAAANETSPVLEEVIRAVCETKQWSWGAYFRVDEPANVLRVEACWATAAEPNAALTAVTRTLTIAPGAGICGRVWQSAQPLWVADIDNDSRVLVAEFVRAAGFHGAFAFPSIAEGRTVGVLQFLSREVREPDERLLSAVAMIGNQVGQWLQRRQVEAALRESEKRFRALTELSSDWYWEQDANCRMVRVSDGIRAHSGFEIASLLGRTRWETETGVDAADRASVDAQVAARLPFRDYPYFRNDTESRRRHVVISGEPMYDANGDYVGYRGVGKDVTERMQAEGQLRFQAMLLDTVGDAIMASNVEETISYWNAAAQQLYGWTRTQAIGRNMLEMIRPATRRHSGAIGEIAHGRIWRGEKIGHRRDGTTFPVHLTLAPFEDASGTVVGVVSVSRDISETKRAEQLILAGARQQELIARFGQRALANTRLDTLLEEAAAAVVEGLAVPFCRILQPAPDGRALTARESRGFDGEPVDRHFAGDGPGTPDHHVYTTHEDIVVVDYGQENRFVASPLFIQYRIRSSVNVVIGGAGGPFGVLAAYSCDSGRFGADSVSFLQNVANTLTTAIDRIVSEQKLAYLAQFDALTGLPNRNLFRDRLALALTQAQRSTWNVGVMFVDLDGFKSVNDTYGHVTGDRLLQQVADRLRQCIRGGDTVGRLGGDEFGVILANLGRGDDANLVAQEMVNVLGQPFDADGCHVAITASIGISVYPADGDNWETLLRNADAAMYLAKQRGRNAFHFYTEELNARVTRRMELEAELRRAIADDEFVLHYQPEISVQTGRIIGVEALIRWQHPTRGLLAPAEFITIAEETGLIVPIGQWVANSACAQAAQWHRDGHRDLFVAINVSPMELRRTDIAAHIGGALTQSGLDPRHLEIELTETLIMDGADSFIRALDALKAIGIGIAIDDFGTGYSSLSYLKRFPVDKVKIDRVFVRDLGNDADDAAIVQAIIAMSHHLKLQVTAEGVETEEQAAFLRRCRCDILQGFLFGVPVEAARMSALLDGRPGAPPWENGAPASFDPGVSA